MKTKKSISTLFASLLLIALCFVATNASAQSRTDSTKVKDCYMMKNGTLMHMQAGKMMPLDKEATLKNGTRFMKNGDYVTKNGEKMKLKEGQCMDVDGKITSCGVMVKDEKKEMNTK